MSASQVLQAGVLHAVGEDCGHLGARTRGYEPGKLLPESWAVYARLVASAWAHVLEDWGFSG